MKNKINTLVIDSNESLAKGIEKYFSSHEVINVVACLNDGEEGLQYILNNYTRIDIIIMDLILPKLDGLFILQELERRSIKKDIIIVTSFKDDDVMDEANKFGVDYYMLKPINFLNLEKRILGINAKERKELIFNQEAIIVNLLHKLGIPSHIRGYQYIKTGIAIVLSNQQMISYVTKEIYPEIAKKYNTTATRVERSIRHAIEVSWTRGDINLMEEIFGNSLDINRDKPTNAEYLLTIADRLRLNQRLVYN